MRDFVNPHIRSYQEYIPGSQSDRKIIKLNANENHLPPHPKIKAYLKKFTVKKIRYYPDPRYRILEDVVRKSYKLKKNVGLVFGNGADEIIRGIFKTFFVSRKDSVLLTEVTYPAYETYAKLEEVKIEWLPVNKDLTVSLKGLDKARSKVFFITNPNSPTGMSIPPVEIIKTVKNNRNKLFIVDEAYAAFSGKSCLQFLPEPNLIVLKTVSKSFSACGLRLGFGAGTVDYASHIRKVLDPYNLSVITVGVGEVILTDLKYMKKCSEQINQIREWFGQQLEKLEFKVYPSQANFLLVSPPDKKNTDKKISTAQELFFFLKRNNIFVRFFDKPLISHCLRITIGSKSDLRKVLSVIRKFYSKTK